jgi:hypothetical protein
MFNKLFCSRHAVRNSGIRVMLRSKNTLLISPHCNTGPHGPRLPLSVRHRRSVLGVDRRDASRARGDGVVEFLLLPGAELQLLPEGGQAGLGGGERGGLLGGTDAELLSSV